MSKFPLSNDRNKWLIFEAPGCAKLYHRINLPMQLWAFLKNFFEKATVGNNVYKS